MVSCVHDVIVKWEDGSFSCLHPSQSHFPPASHAKCWLWGKTGFFDKNLHRAAQRRRLGFSGVGGRRRGKKGGKGAVGLELNKNGIERNTSVAIKHNIWLFFFLFICPLTERNSEDGCTHGRARHAQNTFPRKRGRKQKIAKPSS